MEDIGEESEDDYPEPKEGPILFEMMKAWKN